MMLHALRVSHWRSLLDTVEIGPFGDRLNVIHAPNGTGKSSLFEAMRRGLFDAHHVKGKDIEAVRPWGRRLAPGVRIDFYQSGVTYRLEKTFLDSPRSRLSRLESGRFRPLADGRNADSLIREILSATDGPGRGLSRQEHWGLAQALWVPQGALHLESLSEKVTGQIRSALGVQISGEGGSRLEALLAELYLAHFTKGGRMKTGKQAPPLSGLLERRDSLAETHRRCVDQQLQFEEASRAVEDARLKRRQLRIQADALRETVNETRRQMEAWQTLQEALEQKRREEQTARERYDALHRSLEMIRKTREEIDSLRSAVETGVHIQSGLEVDQKSAARAADDAKAALDRSRRRRADLESLASEVDTARRYVSDSKDRRTLSERVEKLRQLEADLKQCIDLRAEVVAPEDKTLGQIRQTHSAIDTAEAALQASLIRLTLRADQSMTVRRRGSETQQTIQRGGETTFSGSPEVEVVVEGFGNIRAYGPEGNAEGHRQTLRDSRRKLDALTRPYGTQDAEELQLLRDRAADLDRKSQHLNEQLDSLRDGTTRDALLQSLAELDIRIRAALDRFPLWETAPPTLSRLQNAFDQQRRTVERAVDRAENDWEAARTTLQAIDKRLAETTATLKNNRLNLDRANARLKDLTGGRQSFDEMTSARKDALMAWEAAKTRADQSERRLKGFSGDPGKSLQALEKQLEALETDELASRDEENTAAGRLLTLAAEGTYSKLSESQEVLATLDESIRRETLRTEAIRLLYGTVAACKAEVISAVAEPVERAATRMLSRIAGTRLGMVRLTESFVPAGVHPEIAEEAVEWSNLSGGEQEQLFLIARLALGQVLAASERQLVVLDDVLNATDTGRLSRVLHLLEEASNRLQIVILTCHQERYRALDQADFFDLQKRLEP
jgi:DNA repair exonuclease SbcCD ATPase subunit